MRFRFGCLAVAMLFAAASGCVSKTGSGMSVVPDQGVVIGTGTIVFVDVEGGFYAIRSDDGVTYDPRSLPDGFANDGLRVRFTVRILRDAVSFHQVGPIVEVLDLSRLV